MKIAVDISQAMYEGTGVGRYTSYLVEGLVRYAPTHEYIFFFSALRGKLPKKIEQLIRPPHRLVKVPLPPTILEFLWNHVHILPIETFTGNIDLVITSDWTFPPTKAKTMTTIHDLVVYRYPETSHPRIVSTQKKRLSYVLKKCDCIIVDSRSTKEDCIEILSVPEKKIHVIYPPVEVKKPSKKMIDSVLDKYHIHKPYIFTSGKIEPRKNFDRLFKAFKEARIPQLLIVAGPKGWGTENLEKNPPISRDIQMLGYVSDEDLYALYAGADFLVFPSLYEGFGYPAVEAMALGCPVVGSSTSSLGEIIEGVGITFNPNDEKDITRALRQVSSDVVLRKQLSEKGIKKSKEFSLEKFGMSVKHLFDILLI
ncbi:hypothetical protein A2957_02695 [Candidatus Roizmanbacteria bacterium RIFCSPLOWO2_01_FULL_38_11]|uniref:Glycosyl transferase family 1 domain-containing protein n=1 Tax=Candidatus Roizmanbacteria bacterium RIFCSPLOWO2_01_FULL_38_11 TaxID=1802060 RepID=A0A1F7ING5_9BACT|nr:MAG: hypothetical protein A2957_02695 [Candidatus Roizmanbacteria bacterium RIFCSPLOWO2_01_FULL_38_11]